MNTIIDSNILIAALIRNSTTRYIILTKHDLQFFISQYILDETIEKMDIICKKSSLSVNELKTLISALLTKITIVKKERIMSQIPRAYNAMKEIDIDDTQIVACALSINNPVIWSDDKDLKKQNIIPVITTTELMEKLKKRS